MAKRNCRMTEAERAIHDRAVSLRKMTDQLQVKRVERGEAVLSVVYAGGVMSNKFVRPLLTNGAGWRSYFSEPAYSADNAAGTAILCALEAR